MKADLEAGSGRQGRFFKTSAVQSTLSEPAPADFIAHFIVHLTGAYRR